MNASTKPVSNNLVLFAICVASFLTPFSVSSMNIISPELAAYFNANAVLLAWMNTTFFLAAGIVLMPAAKLCDIFGRRKIFTIGVGGFAVFSLLSALSFSIWMLLALRFCQGLCCAFIVGPAITLTTAVFPSSQRGKALSIQVGAVYVGSSVGPFIGGWLSYNWGWRSAFIAFGLVGILGFILIKLCIKSEWKSGATMQKFDYRGTIMYAIGVAALMLGATHLPSGRAFWVVIAGLMAMVSFVIIEKNVDNPVFDTSIFSKYLGFSFSSMAALLHYAALTANTLLLSLYLQFILGYDTHVAGMLLLPQPICMLVSTLIAGRLSDHIDPSYLASLGAVLALAASLMLCLSQNPDLHYIIICQIIIGCGYGAFVSPNTNLIMGSVTRDRYNEASSVAGTMRLLGQVFSLGIISMIFALVIGPVEIEPTVYDKFVLSFQVAYLVYAVLCLGVLALSLPWKFKARERKNQNADQE